MYALCVCLSIYSSVRPFECVSEEGLKEGIYYAHKVRLYGYATRLCNCRHVEIVSLLCQSVKEECPTLPVREPHAHFELVSCNKTCKCV